MKILVVEDELILQELYRMVIKKCGHELLATIDSQETAIEMARNMNPDLIFMDIFLLNQGNGICAAEEIRHFSDAPIVFVTANQDDELIERTQQIKNSDYYSKPLQTMTMKRIIEFYSTKNNES